MTIDSHLSSARENLEYASSIVIYSRFYIASLSPLLLYSLSYLEGFSFSPKLAVTVFGAFFGVYAINRKSDLEEDEENLEFGSPELAEKIYKVGVLSLLLSISTALTIGINIIAAVMTFILIPYIYSFKVFPSSFSYRRLKDIPFVKNIAVGASLGFLWILGAIPSLPSSSFIQIIGVFLFLSTRVFIGSVIPDIRDIEGDRNAGVKTLPVKFGVETTKKILVVANIFAIVTHLWMLYNTILPLWTLYAGATNLITFLVIAKSTRGNSGTMTILSELNTQIIFPVLLIIGALI